MDEADVPTDVSDTARWVAAYRAQESARPDALFRDPLADKLAGEQGRAMAAAAERTLSGGWPIVVRTKLIDDLIRDCLAQGCDRVLNLAAGFDTRPYRLDLPPELLWVEADLPAMTHEKEAALAGATPKCALLRRAVDLADEQARQAFLDEALDAHEPANKPATKALVLTEGLLSYLEPDTVAGLATVLDRPEIAWWIADIALGLAKMKLSMFRNAPLRFDPPNGVAFFEELGWRITDMEPIFINARKLRRMPWYMRPFTYLPQPNPRKPGRQVWSAVTRLQHE
ncbi:SAM-dependent methyltransferase [Nocardia panacis]|uniref:S-adenosyl-L-methionine-dependent methyltransferase n=1 Tax=Nocardia panacis TaxID=2340916 RepID=A0A3A4KR43_9NOCA|nr:SAM-dependent methyltransferase [Nocardia panacis]RJO78310.1 SAM-dependent methyltransferase [Nocardia panacis]